MPAQRSLTVRQLFDAASELDPTEWNRFLVAECAGDQRLLEEVRSLLQHRELAPANFLGRNSESRTLDPTAAGDLPALPVPEVTGFCIRRMLGEGGMGVVYEAEQLAPRRLVALKLVRPGFATGSMIKRFEFEAELLARLDHPGIARIYQAGSVVTALGNQPYFAMELINGKRLDQFVRDSKPSLPQRLELFREIAQAVQHAHARGVVHRDLKPSNIFVTADGKPKILDFGVARLTDSDVQSATMHTLSGQLLGTVPYMSPEQATGRAGEIDPSSDVYSLGVLGFEMLAGRMPYDLNGKPLHQAVQIIEQQEPRRLSALDRTLRGDLETIIKKALEKEKSRRYGNAGDLADDIRRYQLNEPILAHPPSKAYQFRKFVVRHKGLVASLASVFVVLVAGITGTTIGLLGQSRMRQEAERQKSAAEHQAALATEQAQISTAVSKFQIEMLNAADPDRQLGDKVTVLDATRAALKRLDAGELKDQPLVEETLRSTIGATLRSLARYDEAEPALRSAVKVCREKLPANHPDTADCLNNLASLLQDGGKYAEAEALYREATEIQRRQVPINQRELSKACSNLGSVLHNQGKTNEAEGVFREALTLARASTQPGDQHLPQALCNLGAELFMLGRYNEVEPLFQEALSLQLAQLPSDHPALAPIYLNLGALASTTGRLDDAEKFLRVALDIRRKAYPKVHPLVAETIVAVAKVLKDKGQLVDAEPLYREALQMRTQIFPDPHPDVAQTMDGLSTLLQAQGRLQEAEQLSRGSLAIYQKTLPPGHRSIGQALNNLGMIIRDRKDLPQAESLFRQALALYQQGLPAGHPEIAVVLVNLGVTLNSEGKFVEAESTLREAVAIRRSAIPVNPLRLAAALNNLAGVLVAEGKPSEAEPVFREALDLHRQKLGTQAKPTVATAASLAKLLDQLGRESESAAIRRTFPATVPATMTTSRPINLTGDPF